MILKTHSFTLTGLELHERGAKAAIARELGVPPVTVYRWIQRKSVPPGYVKLIEEKVAHKKAIIIVDELVEFTGFMYEMLRDRIQEKDTAEPDRPRS